MKKATPFAFKKAFGAAPFLDKKDGALVSNNKIIVMNTFSGRYLQERSNNNICHENINFFCPSNCQIDGKDQYLLWLNCDGNIQKKLMNYNGNITLLMAL